MAVQCVLLMLLNLPACLNEDASTATNRGSASDLRGFRGSSAAIHTNVTSGSREGFVPEPPDYDQIVNSLPPRVAQIAEDVARPDIQPGDHDPVDAWRSAQNAQQRPPTAAVGSVAGELTVAGNGDLNYHVQLPVPPGPAAVTPNLALNYSSGGLRGWLGKGWSISSPGALVQCQLAPGLDLDAIDGELPGGVGDLRRRYCLNGQPLVRVDERDSGRDGDYYVDEGEYRTLPDSGQRIHFVRDEDDHARFVVRDRAGVDTVYEQLRGSGRWRPIEVSDGAGHVARYDYYTSDSDVEGYAAERITEISYGHEDDPQSSFRRIEFKTWDEGPLPANQLDKHLSYGGESFVVTDRYVGCIDTFAPDGPGGASKIVSRYKLRYEKNPLTHATRLAGVQECGFERGSANPVVCNRADGAAIPGEVCSPETQFLYSEPHEDHTLENGGFLANSDIDSFGIGETKHENGGEFVQSRNLSAVDLNGDGRTDFVWQRAKGFEIWGPEPNQDRQALFTNANEEYWSFRLSHGDEFGDEDHIFGLPRWAETEASYFLNGRRGGAEQDLLVLDNEGVLTRASFPFKAGDVGSPLQDESDRYFYGATLDVTGDGFGDFVGCKKAEPFLADPAELTKDHSEWKEFYNAGLVGTWALEVNEPGNFKFGESIESGLPCLHEANLGVSPSRFVVPDRITNHDKADQWSGLQRALEFSPNQVLVATQKFKNYTHTDLTIGAWAVTDSQVSNRTDVQLVELQALERIQDTERVTDSATLRGDFNGDGLSDRLSPRESLFYEPFQSSIYESYRSIPVESRFATSPETAGYRHRGILSLGRGAGKHLEILRPRRSHSCGAYVPTDDNGNAIFDTDLLCPAFIPSWRYVPNSIFECDYSNIEFGNDCSEPGDDLRCSTDGVGCECAQFAARPGIYNTMLDRGWDGSGWNNDFRFSCVTGTICDTIANDVCIPGDEVCKKDGTDPDCQRACDAGTNSDCQPDLDEGSFGCAAGCCDCLLERPEDRSTWLGIAGTMTFDMDEDGTSEILLPGVTSEGGNSDFAPTTHWEMMRFHHRYFRDVVGNSSSWQEFPRLIPTLEMSGFKPKRYEVQVANEGQPLEVGSHAWPDSYVYSPSMFEALNGEKLDHLHPIGVVRMIGGDWNADGRGDLALVENFGTTAIGFGSTVRVLQRAECRYPDSYPIQTSDPAPKADLLVGVVDGFGNKSAVEYLPLSDTRVNPEAPGPLDLYGDDRCLSRGADGQGPCIAPRVQPTRPVVWKLHQNIGVTPGTSSHHIDEYQYSDTGRDVRMNRSIGFSEVRVKRYIHNHHLRSLEIREYGQTTPVGLPASTLSTETWARNDRWRFLFAQRPWRTTRIVRESPITLAADEQVLVATQSRFGYGLLELPEANRYSANYRFPQVWSDRVTINLVGEEVLGAERPQEFVADEIASGAEIHAKQSQGLCGIEEPTAQDGPLLLPVPTGTIDRYGNVLCAQTRRSDGVVSRKISTYVNDAAAISEWAVSLPKGTRTEVSTPNTPKPDLPDHEVVREGSFNYCAGNECNYRPARVREVIADPHDDQLRRVSKFTYDGRGRLRTSTVFPNDGSPARSIEAVYHEEDPVFPLREINGLGHWTEYVYNLGRGLLEYQRDSNGADQHEFHDALGRSFASIDATNDRYETEFRRLDNTSDLAAPSRVEIIETSPDSQEIRRSLDRVGREIGTSWSGFEGQRFHTWRKYDERGHVVAWSGTRPGEFTAVPTVPVDAFTAKYDDMGRMIHQKDLEGNIVEWDYERRENANCVREITTSDQFPEHPDGLQTKAYGHDLSGRLIWSEDAGERNLVRWFHYDASGGLKYTWSNSTDFRRSGDAPTATSCPSKSLLLWPLTAEFENDARGLPLHTHDIDRGDYFFEYNNLGEMVESTDPAGNISTVQYDGLGRTKSLVTGGRRHNYYYDHLQHGMLTASATTTAVNYSIIDTRGRPRLTASRFADEVAERVEGAGSDSPAPAPTSQSAPCTRWRNDITYDAGDLIWYFDGDEDAVYVANRFVFLNTPPIESDKNWFWTKLLDPSVCDDGTGSSSTGSDAGTEGSNTGGEGGTEETGEGGDTDGGGDDDHFGVWYEYDFDYDTTIRSRLARIIYPNGGRDVSRLQVRYNYDEFGRITEVVNENDDESLWRLTGTDDQDRASVVAFGGRPSGTPEGNQFFEYDRMGRQIQRWANWRDDDIATYFQATSIPRYSTGRPKAKYDWLGDNLETYGYDKAGHLTSWVVSRIDGSGSQLHEQRYAAYADQNASSLGYPLPGQISWNSKHGDYHYGSAPTDNAPGRLRSVGEPGTSSYVEFEYDGNGNVIRRGQIRASYRADNQPNRIWDQQDNEIRFYYGVDSERIGRVSDVDGRSIRYVGGGASQFVDTDFEGLRTSDIRHSVTVGDQVVAQVNQVSNNGGWDGDYSAYTNFVFTDHLGSTEVITHSNERYSQRMSFGPFGLRRNPEDWTDTSGFVNQSRYVGGFTGHDEAEDAGLIFMEARMYDPEYRRFMSPDPVVAMPLHLDGWSAYSYVTNRPTVMRDPSGMTPECEQKCVDSGGDAGDCIAKCYDISSGTHDGLDDHHVTGAERDWKEDYVLGEQKPLPENPKTTTGTPTKTESDTSSSDSEPQPEQDSSGDPGPYSREHVREKVYQAWVYLGAGLPDRPLSPTMQAVASIGSNSIDKASKATTQEGRNASGSPAALTEVTMIWIDAIVDAVSFGSTKWKKAQRMADTLDGANDARKGLSTANKARKAKKAKRRSKWILCFPGHTPVQTVDGELEISEIEVGDIVLAWDEETAELIERPVTALSRSWTTGLVSLDLDDGSSISSTSEHPYWVAELDEWIAAKDLKIGQHLLTVDGDVREIEGVYGESGTHAVFNFTVDEAHNYFAGEAGVLVHNGGEMPLLTLLARVDYNQAFKQALAWLEARGFKAERQTIGKFGPNAGKAIGMQTANGKVGFRVEFDERNGAHINVWSGKEKGPHYQFKGTQKTVNKIVKRFDCP